TGSARQRREVAVLKAVGFVRRQVWAILGSQAITLAAVAVALGIPVGVAVGRGAWALVAGRIGVVVAPVVPIAELAATVLAAVLVANLLAALPARAAVRARPAIVLRSE
ncbi:MAG: FtsX-like permease family protein, partial [Actinomycetota bacterium]|nr:FtsX-like permease family protein [Actinomycetota bacterium]